MNNTQNSATATFGQANSVVTDALSRIIENAPQEPQARACVREHTLPLKDAESFLGRANLRLEALGRASQPYIGQRYSADFVDAANAADLLIASDILVALLLDRQLVKSEKLAYVLGIFLPATYPRPEEGVQFVINAALDEALAIAALHDEDEPVRLRPLAAWHDAVLRGDFACAEPSEGFLADVALVREQLFETYLGRDCEIPDARDLTKTLAIACGYAMVFGVALAERASARQRKAAA